MFPTVINMDGMLGVAFLGNIMAAVLYGIICQAFLFLNREHDKDQFVCWRMVSALWIMDAANLALTTHALYYYMISNYGNVHALASPTWSILAMIYITCVNNVVIRYVLGREAWSISGHRVLLTVFILVPTLGAFTTGFAFSSLEWKAQTFEHFSKISYLLYLSLGSGFIADGIIAITLCISLWRSRTGFPRTDSILKSLMLYTINTGLLTSLCNLACFIAYAVRPHELIFLAFYCILSKTYFNSLLAVLNRQDYLNKRMAVSTLPIGLANIPAKQPVCAMANLHTPHWRSIPSQNVRPACVLRPVLIGFI
ncbi:hypothetical protein BD779DRAFT_1581580 [Infundibulicybe gibba]|nr:hypothetical protein BD779DRAFT_1581580 [Infundibulicybe gibba]